MKRRKLNSLKIVLCLINRANQPKIAVYFDVQLHARLDLYLLTTGGKLVIQSSGINEEQ